MVLHVECDLAGDPAWVVLLGVSLDGFRERTLQVRILRAVLRNIFADHQQRGAPGAACAA